MSLLQDLAVSIDDTVAEDVDLDMCSPTAVFADGSKVELKQVSVAEYRAICAKPAGSSSSNVKWTGQHKISHHKLTVTSKADRSLLVVMTEQGAQILQLKVFWFGDEGDAKSIATAFELMTSIAKRYENDVIKKDDLYAERDNELASRGIHKGKRPSNAKSKATALKKPAAAPTEPHPSEGSKAKKKKAGSCTDCQNREGFTRCETGGRRGEGEQAEGIAEEVHSGEVDAEEAAECCTASQNRGAGSSCGGGAGGEEAFEQGE